jgi:replicative DNA helicase
MIHVSKNLNDLKTKFIGQPMGLSTGFSELDNLIWGLQPGQLVVFGARSGCGKTSLLADLAISAGKKDEVCVLSLEMPMFRMQARLACSLASVNYGKARANKLIKEETKRFDRALAELKKYKITINDESGIVGNDPYWLKNTRTPVEKTMDYKIKSAVDKGCKLFLIDYLQLCVPLRPTQDRGLAYGSIALALRDYAKEYGVCMVLFSQLRKFDQGRYEKKGQMPEPTLDDLKYTGDIEIHSDVIVLLHRPRQGKGDSPLFADIVEDDAKFLLMKNRDGGTKEIAVDFVASSMSWRDRDSFERF